MHQSHNIAWDSLSSNLVFIYENRKITPHRTDLFSRGLPSEAASLNHFVRTVASTIRKFSDTERAKYPATYSAPTEGPLFSDALLARYLDPDPCSNVNANTQRIEYWVARASVTTGADGPRRYYGEWNSELADVVKILLAENELGTLLMLAQHPDIPIHCLYPMGHYSFGWDCVRYSALHAYIYLNVLLCKPELLADGRYKSMNSYKSMVSLVTGHMYAVGVEAFPHQQFFWGTSMEKYLSPEEVDSVNDFQKLHDYLKLCFRLLYQYDVLARECGIRVNWEEEITSAVAWPSRWGKVSTSENGEGKWVTRFV